MVDDVLTVLSTGKKYNLKALGDVRFLNQTITLLYFLYQSELKNHNHLYLYLQAGPVIDAGGIFSFARATGMIKAAQFVKLQHDIADDL